MMKLQRKSEKMFGRKRQWKAKIEREMGKVR